VVNNDIGLLFNWLDKLGYNKCFHPNSIEEISKHKDESVVRTMMIKIKNYQELKTLSADDPKIVAIRSTDKSRNDEIDTNIVKELYNHRVDFVITEDRGIHRKARTLGVAEKVYKIDAFIEKVVAENPELVDYQVLSVKKDYFGNVNIGDDFFNSFKGDYSEFEGWFNKKSDKIAYVSRADGEVKAFLYLKVENAGSEAYSDITPPFKPKKRLKIGTFKVVSTGFKLGERFLKIIFDNALQYQVDEIYVTIFDKRDEQIRLIQLLKDWGFKYWGEKNTANGIEKVFIKPMPSSKEDISIRSLFPYIKKNSQKLIVPIWPDYHTELFPDSYLNTESPHDYEENEPHRNAIKKIYISRSYYKRLNPGDLVLFYRTGGHYKGVISTLGVVESIQTSIRDEKHFVDICRKRSIFDDEELKKWWNWKPKWRPFVVNFLYLESFPMPKINLARLRQEGLLSDAPRGFEPISDEVFFKILKLARANGNYFIN
jgi:hypothetical protein